MRLMALLVCASVFLAAPAQAQVTPAGSVWSPGPGAAGSATYSGAIDQSPSGAATQLSGWIVDTTAQGWTGIDEVQIWDGLMQAGGHELAPARIQLARPDVAAALNNPYWAPSGFSATLPADSSPSAVLYVYAHTPAKGWWYQLVLRSVSGLSTAPPTVQIDTPTPLATVHSNTPYTARGYGFDPAAGPTQGTGIDRVQLYLGGDRSSGTYIGDATLGLPNQSAAAAGSQFANGGWQLQFQPNSWIQTSTDNQLTPLTVYAHSAVTGTEVQTQTTIVISVP